jgi:hypothetical protein
MAVPLQDGLGHPATVGDGHPHHVGGPEDHTFVWTWPVRHQAGQATDGEQDLAAVFWGVTARN